MIRIWGKPASLAIAMAGANLLLAGETVPTTVPANAPAQVGESKKTGDAARNAATPLAINLGRGIILDMVWIPTGKFNMGCTNKEAIRLLSDDVNSGIQMEGIKKKVEN
jgi:hypothetical protein